MSQNNDWGDIFSSEYGDSASTPELEPKNESSDWGDIFSSEYATQPEPTVADLADTTTNKPTAITTIEDDASQMLDHALKNPNEVEPMIRKVADENYESEQLIHSTDYGLFQINEKQWNPDSMAMFGKTVNDLSTLEQIQLAGKISKSPLGMNNWVAFNKGNHKQFENITDEDLIGIGLQPFEIDAINKSFDNPKIAKQVLMAESAGNPNAINVNYTPQNENNKIVPDWLQESARTVTAQPATTFASIGKEVKGVKFKGPIDTFNMEQTSPVVEDMSEISAFPPPEKSLLDRKKFYEENQLSMVLPLAMEKSLTGKMFGVTSDIQTEMAMLDANPNFAYGLASDVLAFLMPVDAVTFSGLSRLGAKLVQPLLTRTANKIIATGVAPEKAMEIAQKSVVGYLNKSTSMSMGVGGHSGANEFFNQLNNAGVSDFDASAVYKSFGVGSLTGFSGGIGAGIFGKTFSSLGKYGGTIGDFLGEVGGFAVSGEALADSDIPLLERLSDPKTYAHSAGMILSMRLIHGVGREFPKKLNSITKEQVAEKIESNFQKNLAEKSKDPNQLSLDLYNEQVKESYDKAVIETAEQLELPLNIKTKESVDSFTKKAKKDLKKTPEQLETEIEKNEAKVVRTQKEKENTGVDINLSKRRTKKAKEAKKRNELAQEIADKIEAGEYGNSPKEIQDYQNNAKQVEKILQEKADKKPSTEVDLDRDVPKPQSIKKAKTKKQIAKKPKKSGLEQVQKSSDLKPAKKEQAIKGERGKTFKNKNEFDRWASGKQSDYIGTNIVIRYLERPDGKVVAKIFEKLKEQPLEKTTKGWTRKIEKEDLGAPDIPNPENAYSDRIKIQRFEHEINELAFGRDKQIAEIDKIENKSLDLFNKPIKNLTPEQSVELVKETGVSLDYISKLKLSIDARTKRIETSKRELRSKMTALELAQDTAKKLSRRTSVGSLNPKKTSGKKNEMLDREIIENVKELWKRMTDGTRVTKSKFLNYLTDLNLKDPQIRKYVAKHFDDIKKVVELENAQQISDQILMTPKQSDGTPKPVRKTPDELEYAGPVSLYSMFPKYNQANEVRVLKELIDNFGYDKVEKIRNRRTAKEMRRNSRKKDVLVNVFSRIANGEGKSLNFSEHVIATADITKTMIELAFADPKKMENPVFRDLLNNTLSVFQAFRSEAGRALKATGLEPEVNPKLFEIMANIPKDKSGEFRNLMDAMTKLAEIRKADPSAVTNAFWMVAEALRNSKLLSMTSLYKSVIGNAQHSAMEVLTNKSGLKLGWSNILDPKREQSGLSKFDYSKYELINKTEVYHEAFFGENGAIKSAMEIMKENPDFLRDNPLLINEAYSRFIPGKVGKVIRAPQNAQGALDALYRLPWTVTRFETLVIRQAVKELRKEIGDKNLTKENVLERSLEIKEDTQASQRLLSESKAYAAEMVFQAPFRTKAGKALNSVLRTNQESLLSAAGNWQVPFLLTYKNVFSKAFEFSPLVVTTHNFWEGYRMHKGNLHKAPFRKGAGTQEKNSDLLAETMARATLGTAITALVAGTAMSFKRQRGEESIIGSMSDMSPEERDVNRVLGRRPNSIKLGNNYWSFSTLGEPLSIYLTAASNYHDKKTKTHKTALGRATQVVNDWLNNNPIFLQADLISDVITGRMTLPELLAKKSAGELPPTFMKQLKSIRDGQLKRYPRGHKFKDSGEQKNAIDRFLDASKKELSPFWAFSESKDIDPSRLVYDLFGNPVPKNSNMLNMVNIRYTEDKSNDDKYLVEREYLKAFPEQGYNMQYLGGKISYGDGYTMEMSPRELQYLHEYTGKAFKAYMEKYVRHENWNSPEMDAQAKRDMFEGGRSFVNNIAKATLLNKYYEIGKYVNMFDKLARAENIIITRGLLSGENEESKEMLNNIQNGLAELRNKVLPNMSDEDLQEIHRLMTNPNRYHANKHEAMSILKQNMPKAEGWVLNNTEDFEKEILNRLMNSAPDDVTPENVPYQDAFELAQ